LIAIIVFMTDSALFIFQASFFAIKYYFFIMIFF